MITSVGVAGYKRDKVTPVYKKVPNPNLQKYIPPFQNISPKFFSQLCPGRIHETTTLLEFLEGRDGRMVDKVSGGILQGYVYWVTGNNGHIIVDVWFRPHI